MTDMWDLDRMRNHFEWHRQYDKMRYSLFCSIAFNFSSDLEDKFIVKIWGDLRDLFYRQLSWRAEIIQMNIHDVLKEKYKWIS